MPSTHRLFRVALAAGLVAAVACVKNYENHYTVTSPNASALNEAQQALAQRVSQTQVLNGS